MPNPGTAKAPATWKGDEDDLSEFLDRFEALADDAGLDDDDKIKFFRKYVSKKQRPLFEVIEGAKPADWSLFTKSINELFPKAFEPQTYSRRRMDKLTAQAARHEITTQDEFEKFYREFLPVSQWLVSNRKISVSERDLAFWYGFHPRTQNMLTQQLRIELPKHDRADPYPMREVYKVARYVFDRNAFDMDQPSTDESEEAESSVTEDSDTEDEEWRRKKKKKKGKSKTKLAKKGNGRKVVVTMVEKLPPTTGGASEAEIGDLVKRLTSLRVNEPDYAVAYARLIIALPSMAMRFPGAAVYTAVAATPPVASPMPSLYLQFPAAQSFALHPQGSFPGDSGQRTCGFCKRAGCWMKQCPVAAQYVWEGKIIVQDSWYRWPNGGRIESHPNGLQFVIDKFYNDHPHLLPLVRVNEATTQQPALYLSTWGGTETKIEQMDGTSVQSGTGAVVDVKVVEEFVVNGRPSRGMAVEDGERRDEEEQAGAFLVEVEEVQEGAEVFVTTRSGLSSDKAPPVSQGCTPPQYSFRSRIEDPGLNNKALQEVLETPVTVSLRQLLSTSTGL